MSLSDLAYVINTTLKDSFFACDTTGMLDGLDDVIQKMNHQLPAELFNFLLKSDKVLALIEKYNTPASFNNTSAISVVDTPYLENNPKSSIFVIDSHKLERERSLYNALLNIFEQVACKYVVFYVRHMTVDEDSNSATLYISSCF